MSNLKTYLSMYLKENQMTQKDFAATIHTQPNTLSQWVNGKRQPDPETWIKLSKALGVPVDYLIGNSPSPQKEKGAKIPVYGNVAAGIPIEAITDIEDYEEIPEHWLNSGEFIALRIKGDSMEPRIENGDVVIVRLQSAAETGDTVIALINGDEATCKKIKIRPEGIMLSSINTAYEPMFYSNKEIEELPVRILGVVVELRGKFKNV